MNADTQSWLAPAVVVAVLLIFVVISAMGKRGKKSASGSCGHGCGCHKGPQAPKLGAAALQKPEPPAPAGE